MIRIRQIADFYQFLIYDKYALVVFRIKIKSTFAYSKLKVTITVPGLLVYKMIQITLFILLSIPMVLISRHALHNLQKHGFYRLLCWECIAALLVLNYKYWFRDAFGINQVISWILLFVSAYFVSTGALLLSKSGKPDKNRNDKSLYRFERTSQLVTTGIYKYIRHPLYSSLLLLTWGICLKDVTPLSFILALLSSAFLYLTAVLDEKECVVFFGEKYKEYMNRTKMFVPFIF